MTSDNQPNNETLTEKSNSTKRTYAKGSPEAIRLDKIFGEGLGDCPTIGRPPRDISEAKVGDWVTICTDEGKCWVVDVISRNGDILHLKNKYVRLVLNTKTGRLWNIYEQDTYSACLENIPKHMINHDIIEYINPKKSGERTDYILQLIALHLNNMNEEQKDKLIEALWEIQRPGSPRLKQGLSKKQYNCVFSKVD